MFIGFMKLRNDCWNAEGGVVPYEDYVNGIDPKSNLISLNDLELITQNLNHIGWCMVPNDDGEFDKAIVLKDSSEARSFVNKNFDHENSNVHEPIFVN